MNNLLSKYIPLFLIVCSFVFVSGCFDKAANTSENGDAPAAEEQTPAVEEQVPAAEEQTPAVEEQVPAVEEQTPAIEEQTRSDELQTNQYSGSNHYTQQVDLNFFGFMVVLFLIVCVFCIFLYVKDSHNKKTL